jgi:hypothetical protein
MKQRARRQSDPGAMLADQVVSVIPTPKVSRRHFVPPGEVCLETLNRSFTPQKGNKMLDSLEKPTGELKLVELPTKRELIEDALRTDPQKSDRAIAKCLGVDHKTVGAARARLGANSPMGKPPASQSVTNRNGVTLSPELFPILNAAPRTGEKKFNPFDPSDDCLIAPERLGLACFVNTRNNVVIANGNVRDGIDEMVQVNPIDLAPLIARLSDIASEFRDGVYASDDEGES